MKGRSKKPSVGDRIIQGLRDFAGSLESNEPITKKFTCRVIELDLRPSDYSPELVKETRHLLHSSQAVFARFLGVSVKTVRAWELGTNTPSEMACRFMDEIRINPDYWIKRLEDAVVTR